MKPVEDQRNYLTGTLDRETAEPVCFAVFLLRDDLQDALQVNSWLGGHVYPWIDGKAHAAAIEVMWASEGAQVQLEQILLRIGENLEMVKWCHQMVPEVPDDETATNCFETLDAALTAWGLS